MSVQAEAAQSFNISADAGGAEGEETLTLSVSVRARGVNLRERLESRLRTAAQLVCPEHHRSPEAVLIDECENGWFDSRWTTCCDALETRARAVVGSRIGIQTS